MKQHPDYAVSVLLRNEPDNFKTLYPNVHVVKGDYDSADLLTEAASKADVVVRACRCHFTYPKTRHL